MFFTQDLESTLLLVQTCNQSHRPVQPFKHTESNSFKHLNISYYLRRIVVTTFRMFKWLEGPMGLITRLDKQKGALEVLGKKTLLEFKHSATLRLVRSQDYVPPQILGQP